MVTNSINKSAAVEVLSKYLASFSNYSYAELAANHQLLIDQIAAFGVEWKTVSDELHVSKSKLYHWFRETFVRKLADRITADDMDIIKTQVGLHTQKDDIQELLSREYNCQVFNVAIQNARKMHQRRALKHALVPSYIQMKPTMLPSPIQDRYQKWESETVIGSFRSHGQANFTLEMSSDFSIQLD
ncbi:hypothetical protein SS50377_27790 [Spironucleus salmonicida]|uniref:Uncharacterized protein n=1 Tax=Spironucleus salmonicida TaxID=348837 RepID=V6LTD0_9EUKA|nr:hypothetical protein SS50377_27790 [Spironucleus salmonicida]|eukprot:EST46951.1 hypothetical protein SS50377_13010 [Spironucleus salmonicida]